MNDLGKVLNIDHVIPSSSFNILDKNERHKAMNWKNLMPLESKRNRQKYDKIDPWLMVMQEVKAYYFLKHLDDSAE